MTVSSFMVLLMGQAWASPFSVSVTDPAGSLEVAFPDLESDAVASSVIATGPGRTLELRVIVENDYTTPGSGEDRTAITATLLDHRGRRVKPAGEVTWVFAGPCPDFGPGPLVGSGQPERVIVLQVDGCVQVDGDPGGR